MKALVFAMLFAVGVGVAAKASAADLKVGDPAPNFSLKATDGKTYKLTDFKGKQAIVLAWFPAAFTAGCTIECKSLAEKGDLIKKYDVTYFMASTDALEARPDNAKSGNIAFAQEHKADFPILSDPTKEAAGAYGVLGPAGTSPRATRWTFYIDKNGIITYIDKEVNAHLATSAEFMAAKLGELKVAEKPHH